MKFIAVTLALAAAALAQDTPSTRIPECANSCVTQATSGNKIAGCNQGDIKCVCSNDSFLDSIACCLVDVCDEAGQKAAVSFALALCSGAGVSVPSEVVCKTAGGNSDSASSGAPASGSATESGSAATGTTSGAAGSTPSSTESSAPTSSGAAGVVGAPVGGLLGGVLAALALL
ncbi:Uncharacterized protein SAPIO_CDS3087 [Scedosporium apiospermum]|uniref:CFEM domain-containing protein n=1 Tax=Pseudallescheria apiosperma TaxID=563466 RepID=A0A084GA01_PSEDA|nr:Uncharacterized protein SAPIO_CDS3087 [Scedosporium apiospermum]KEZ44163.1 Uncharacterized protein SAPIO_CDS3087 [Scedosporium apiospermum]